jgi:hypothetical protein
MVLAFNILGVINWQLKWYRPEGPLSMDEVSKEIVSFVMHGLLGPSHQTHGPITSTKLVEEK